MTWRRWRSSGACCGPATQFAPHDVHAGPVQPIVFPVPWADGPAVSFLATPQETRSLVTSAGFELIQWRDRSQEAIEFFKARAAASQRPALGVHVYVPDLAAKSRNQVRNFEYDRLRVTQAIFRAACACPYTPAPDKSPAGANLSR